MVNESVLWEDYELIDSGHGRKLERYGPYTLVRPDPQAIWGTSLPESEWNRADASYVREHEEGGWHFRRPLPEHWTIRFRELCFKVKPTSFKHTGVFPEQAVNWVWLQGVLKHYGPADVLNLFAYTGGATLAAATSGARVCHVDASKGAVRWARENQQLSGLQEKPVRWIQDDVQAFVSRELRRGHRYHGIIMDPPPYGRGVSGELWKIETHLCDFVKRCARLLHDKPAFFLINGYATGYSHHSFRNLLDEQLSRYPGTILSGDMLLPHSSSGKFLPCGVFARWSGI